MSSMQTPQERYLHDPMFNRVADTFHMLLREHGWSFNDIANAWMLAEQLHYEAVRRLSSEGTGSE